MRELLVNMAITFGTLEGSLRDPVYLVMLAITCVIGVKVRSPLVVLVFAGICVAIRQVIAANNRAELGLGPASYPWALPAATIFGIFVVWGLFRLIKRIMQKSR